MLHLGASPSGKAAVFGTAIPRFESWRPNQLLHLMAIFLRDAAFQGAMLLQASPAAFLLPS
jgi:hypothetical protein